MLLNGTRITIVDDRWQRAAEDLSLSTYEQIAGYAGKIVNTTGTTVVYHLDGGSAIWPGGVYLKKFQYALKGARFILRTAKPYLEMRNYRFLNQIGVNVPSVLAVGQKRVFGSLTDAFIITAGIPAVTGLEDFVQEKCEVEIKAVFDELAGMVKLMHDHHFYHIDLQWRNVLVQRLEGLLKVYLIDSPRGGRRLLPVGRFRGRVRDIASLDKLARVYFSAAQRLRWYKKYAGVDKLSLADRLTIRAITADLNKRVRRT